MKIHYHFFANVDVEDGEYLKSVCREVDFVYDVEPSERCVAMYLVDGFEDMDDEAQRNAIDDVLERIDAGEFRTLESEPGFLEFVRDYYEQDAKDFYYYGG